MKKKLNKKNYFVKLHAKKAFAFEVISFEFFVHQIKPHSHFKVVASLSLSFLAGFPFVCQECNKSDLCAWLTSGFSWAYTHTYSVVR